jgi:transposase
VIDYHTFHQIHHLHKVEHLNQAQIAAELQLDEGTGSKWLQSEPYRPCQMPKRPSKLDPFKGTILRMLERHPYSSAQRLPRLKEQGYAGSYSILKAFVHHVRPAPTPAFLTLQFAPGECAQADWGQAGVVSGGSTRRRLSFFVMVLCHSRMR